MKLLTIFLLISIDVYAQDCAQCTQEPDSLITSGISTLINISKANAQNLNVKQFCSETMKAGYDKIFSDAKKDFEKYGKGNNKKDDNFLNYVAGSTWLLAAYPNYEIRKYNYSSLIKNYPEQKQDKRTVTDILQSKTNPGKYSFDNPNGLSLGDYDISQLDQKSQDHEKDISNSMLAKYTVCASYGLMNVNTCIKSLDKIVEAMTPKTSADTSLSALYKKILADEPKNEAHNKLFVEGAKLAALKVMQRIDSKENPPKGNLHDDILNSFKSLGLRDDPAEDMSYELLGLLSTHGPNTYQYVKGYESAKTYPLSLALAILGSGTTVLDMQALKSGNTYSYPPEVKTSCEYGKFYHFWMSAYLARETAKEFKDSDAAIHATWIAQLGYQMKSTTAGRDPKRAFTIKTFDPANNKLRLDLAFASAGAVYGAKSVDPKLKTKELNVDSAIKNLIQNATELNPVSEQQAKDYWDKGTGAEGYYKWRQIFSPDSALETFYK